MNAVPGEYVTVTSFDPGAEAFYIAGIFSTEDDAQAFGATLPTDYMSPFFERRKLADIMTQLAFERLGPMAKAVETLLEVRKLPIDVAALDRQVGEISMRKQFAPGKGGPITLPTILSVLRNPYGWETAYRREVQLLAADKLEEAFYELEHLVDMTYCPNPHDPERRYVQPGKGLSFSNLVNAVRRLLGV